jgi:uncharacterized protein YoxC
MVTRRLQKMIEAAQLQAQREAAGEQVPAELQPQLPGCGDMVKDFDLEEALGISMAVKQVGMAIKDLRANVMAMSKAQMAARLEALDRDFDNAAEEMHKEAVEAQQRPSEDKRAEDIVKNRADVAARAAAQRGITGAEKDKLVADAVARELQKQAAQHNERMAAAAAEAAAKQQEVQRRAELAEKMAQEAAARHMLEQRETRRREKEHAAALAALQQPPPVQQQMLQPEAAAPPVGLAPAVNQEPKPRSVAKMNLTELAALPDEQREAELARRAEVKEKKRRRDEAETNLVEMTEKADALEEQVAAKKRRINTLKRSNQELQASYQELEESSAKHQRQNEQLEASAAKYKNQVEILLGFLAERGIEEEALAAMGV